MLFKTIQIDTFSQLTEQLSSYDSGWVFRGHTRASWELGSTLERILSPLEWNPGLAEACEQYSLEEFRSRAHHYMADSSGQLLTTLGWLALMQHHGVPTRLLDFTQSPFFALFFAFREVPPDQKEPCSVWALNYRQIMHHSIDILRKNVPSFKYDYTRASLESDIIFDELLSTGKHDLLWVTEPRHRNTRLERQKGTFLVSGNVRSRISDIPNANIPKEAVEKIDIPATFTREVFRLLTSMGIDNSRLFSDLDGLAADIKSMMLYQFPHRYLSNKD